MKRIWNNFFIGFINGIAILTPVIITILIIRFLVIKLNDMLFNPLLKLLSPLQLAGYEARRNTAPLCDAALYSHPGSSVVSLP